MKTLIALIFAAGLHAQAPLPPSSGSGGGGGGGGTGCVPIGLVNEVLVDSGSGACNSNPYTIPATIAAHQTLVATGTTAVVAKTLPNCTDTGGNHLNYTQSTDAFSCGTSGGGGGTPGGSTTQVQYNNAGVFGGISEVTSDGTNIITANGVSSTAKGYRAYRADGTTKQTLISINASNNIQIDPAQASTFITFGSGTFNSSAAMPLAACACFWGISQDGSQDLNIIAADASNGIHIGNATRSGSSQEGDLYLDVQTGKTLHVAINAVDQLLASSAGLLPQVTAYDAGSTTKPFRNLYLLGSGTFGSHSMEFTGAPSGNRVYTFPDLSGTMTQTIASGAKALDFASTAAGACATVITDTATGTASTDVIIFTTNASIKAVTGYVPASTGGFSINAYPTTNTVNFEACNWTAGTVDPGSITVNWKVVR